MRLAYAFKLDLKVRQTNVKAKKIDGSIFETFGIMLTSFQMKNKFKKARFFEEKFLLTDINMKVVLRMSFLILSNANIEFVKKELIYKFYTIAEALPPIKCVELIKKKKFTKIALDENSEAFVIYITF